MKIHFTSGYHPEADRQTEHTNQTLEQYLHIFCNYQQDNCASLLPLSEFAYNNAPSATTGTFPFFANKGYHPNLTVHPERDLASAAARNFVVNLDDLHQELRRNILDAQKRYQGRAEALPRSSRCSAKNTSCTQGWPRSLCIGKVLLVKPAYSEIC